MSRVYFISLIKNDNTFLTRRIFDINDTTEHNINDDTNK